MKTSRTVAGQASSLPVPGQTWISRQSPHGNALTRSVPSALAHLLNQQPSPSARHLARAAHNALPMAPDSRNVRWNITCSGLEYTSIDSLSEEQRRQHLRDHDPVQILGLTDQSKLYLIADRHSVVGGAVTGHCHSDALIANHLALKKNVRHEWLAASTREADADHQADLELAGQSRPLLIANMKARELATPSLNVLFGSGAMDSALARADPNSGIATATLGDFRSAGGGTVFREIGAAAETETCAALCVSLPKGQSVRVTWSSVREHCAALDARTGTAPAGTDGSGRPHRQRPDLRRKASVSQTGKGPLDIPVFAQLRKTARRFPSDEPLRLHMQRAVGALDFEILDDDESDGESI